MFQKILARLRALWPFPIFDDLGPMAVPHLPIDVKAALQALGDCGSNVRQTGMCSVAVTGERGVITGQRPAYVFRGWRGQTTLTHPRLVQLTSMELLSAGRLTQLGRVTLRHLRGETS